MCLKLPIDMGAYLPKTDKLVNRNHERSMYDDLGTRHILGLLRLSKSASVRHNNIES